MPRLEPLLKELSIETIGNVPASLEIAAVAEDSRRCGPETLFVAIEGSAADGHDFLKQAAGNGAKAALISKEAGAIPGMELIRVADARRALALITQRLAGDPSHAMRVVGVTGSKGKTTVAYLMESIFEAAGMRAGVLGTVDYRWPGHVEPAPNTTPSPVLIAEYLKKMKEAGVGGVAMEVSSHAIEQRRVEGIRFAACAFTNLAHEHLDYHRTMEEYARAKERLFTEILPENPAGVAAINVDDPIGRKFVISCRARRVVTYSRERSNAHVFAKRVGADATGQTIELQAFGKAIELHTPMPGTFNIMNCLTAAALGMAAGIPDESIVQGIAKMKGAPGRFEPVLAGQNFNVIVDYAHTPDSLEKALENARGIAKGKLIVVFGAGGDRDPSKREPMGEAAARLADEIIVTSDNPRTENPEEIAAQVIEGVKAGLRRGKRWHLELDRRNAIDQGLKLAADGDTVLIAGKGHEDYQIIGKEKIHFDDRETARELLNNQMRRATQFQ